MLKGHHRPVVLLAMLLALSAETWTGTQKLQGVSPGLEIETFLAFSRVLPDRGAAPWTMLPTRAEPELLVTDFLEKIGFVGAELGSLREMCTDSSVPETANIGFQLTTRVGRSIEGIHSVRITVPSVTAFPFFPSVSYHRARLVARLDETVLGWAAQQRMAWFQTRPFAVGGTERWLVVEGVANLCADGELALELVPQAAGPDASNPDANPRHATRFLWSLADGASWRETSAPEAVADADATIHWPRGARPGELLVYADDTTRPSYVPHGPLYPVPSYPFILLSLYLCDLVSLCPCALVSLYPRTLTQ